MGRLSTDTLANVSTDASVGSDSLPVVVVETLAIAIRQNTTIKAILLRKEETKLLQYVDETTAVLSDRDSAHAIFNLLDVFRKLSGLKINTSKTERMWVGSLKKPFGVKWCGKPIKALGVYYSYDTKLLHEKNFVERLDSVKKLVNLWSSRGEEEEACWQP